MRVLFIGTGDIGLPSLRALLASERHEVVGVVTQPDKPVGRKQVLTAPATKNLALEAGIPVLQPERIREEVTELAALQSDIAVVIAYGQILSQAVLDTPRLGCLNVHASLLPRHRGASPIQAAIREGDPETGVTIMYMDAGLDTGDILLEERTEILPDETGGELHDRLASMAPSPLEKALDLLASGQAPRIPQSEEDATYAGKLLREDGKIDWRRPAVELERFVRAYHPWPGTFTPLPDGQPFKIHEAAIGPETEIPTAPGTVLASDTESGLRIACGRGTLQLTEVQRPGSRRVSSADFLRGQTLEVGSILG